MEDAKKVVDLAVEPTPQISEPVAEVVDQQQPTVETPVVEQAPVLTVPPVNADVDEFGVPWKNRAMEWRRKSEEIVDKLPQMIEEKLSKVTQPQAQTYTYEQLEAYKLQNSSDPNIVAWSTAEQRKIQANDNQKLFEDVVGRREKATKEEITRQRSIEYVQKEYPMAFKKDASGNPVAWDDAHPIAQTIRGLMQNPQLANNPEGLAAAADIAYGRYMRSQAPAMQQKIQETKAEVKQAQKASLTEGAGRRTTISAPPQQAAIESLRKTGSIKDAEAAIGAILRGRGMLEQ